MQRFRQDVSYHILRRQVLQFNFFGLDVVRYEKISDLDVSTALTCRSSFACQENCALIVLEYYSWTDVHPSEDQVLSSPEDL